MRKEKLIEIIYERLPNYNKYEITRIVNEFLEVIKEILSKGEEIELRGFGTFYVKNRNAKKVRNPKTGEIKFIEKRKVPYFKPGVVMKDIVNSGNYYRVTKNRKEGE